MTPSLSRLATAAVVACVGCGQTPAGGAPSAASASVPSSAPPPDSTPDAPDGPGPGVPAGPRVVRRTLANGMLLIARREPTATRLAVEVLHPAGFAQEPRDRPHVAHLVEHLVTRRAETRFAAGAVVNAETLGSFVHFDYLVAPGELASVLEAIAHHAEPLEASADEVQREAERCLSELDLLQKSPQGALVKFALIALAQVERFGARRVELHRATRSLELGAANAFVRAHYGPAGTVVVFAGPAEPGAVVEAAERRLTAVAARDAEPVAPSPPLADAEVQTDLGRDAVFVVGPRPQEPADRAALTLYGAWLAGQLASDAELGAVARFAFASGPTYPVGDLPFFAYAEARGTEPAPGLGASLLAAMARARARFDAATFTAVRRELDGFFAGAFAPAPGVASELVLLQGALDAGVRELLPRGEHGEPRALFAALDHERVARALATFAAPGRTRTVRLEAEPPVEVPLR